MAYVRGHRGDYDRWAAAGLTHWSYAHVLPYFRRQESWAGGADCLSRRRRPARHDDRAVRPIRSTTRSSKRAWRAGIPFTADYNGAQQEGFCRTQSTIRNGRRCSAAVAYLHPALARGANLAVEVGALARRILFEGARAVGIEYEQARRERRPRAPTAK